MLVLATNWDKYTAIGTLAAAGATVLLAAVTVWLVWTTRRAVKGEAEQLSIQRRALEASQTPYVFPAPTADWTDGLGVYSGGRWGKVLPIRNGGTGLALNVRGRLRWGPPSGTQVPFVRMNLGPGDYQEIQINWGEGGAFGNEWDNMRGVLHYEDVLGRAWRTEFTIGVEGRRQIVVGDIRLRRPDDSEDL
jgi:hypothetical protein